MIKALQKKFVVTAMIAVTILLLALLGGINAVNTWTTIKETDNLLDALSRSELEPIPQPPEDNRGRRGFFSPPLTEDDKLSAVFFTARLDNFGAVAQVDVSHITSVTEEEVKLLIERIYKEGKTSGKVGQFKYTSLLTPDGRGSLYIFMDVSTRYNAVFRVAVLSVLAGFICWGLMLLLVMALSKKAIYPIAENMQKQKQFVTDAGHEIKTPLAIILANTEAMELHNGESKWSRNIREQIARLNGLMQNLLTLSRADESKVPVNMTRFSLSDVTADTLRFFSESMELKRHTLCTEISSNITICANKEQISRVISILMDNAVKYSPFESEIVLSLQRLEKTAVLQIENTCEELPACAPEKLFDRFYRADAARTQKNGGYGIGLSAAQAIVRLHHGTIEAAYKSQNRMIFTVKLPAEKS